MAKTYGGILGSNGKIDPNYLESLSFPQFVLTTVNGVKTYTIVDGNGNAIDFAALYATVMAGLPTLGTPTVTFGTVTATSIIVNWTAVTNATSYTVKRNTSNTQSGATTIYTGNLLTFTDNTGLNAATPYFYFVIPTATSYNPGTAGTGSATTLSSGGSYANTEATNYFTAANITDATFKTAWDNLVSAAKSDGYYSKFVALFPLPGSAAINRYDAITATQKAIFSSTGVVHAATGVTFDGSAGYMDGGIAPSAVGQNALGYFYYNRANPGAVQVLLGASSSPQTYLYRNGSTTIETDVNGVNGATTNSIIGILGAIRTSATNINAYLGTTLLTNSAGASNSAAPASTNFWAGGLNSGGSLAFASSSECGGWGILNGFTNTDWMNFAADFQTFLTAISR